MKSYFYILLFISNLLFGSCDSNTNDSFKIENNLISKTFYFNKSDAGSIDVQVKMKSKLISDSKSTPFFEFVINNKLVSSNDEVWVYESHSKREMGNGGYEHLFMFKGAKENVKGLLVNVYQQVFSNSTLIREKLELKGVSESFQLNKLNDKLHFYFPGYALKNKGGNEVSSTEIRIASWEKKPTTFGRRKGNHMYYPDVIQGKVTRVEQSVKGPLLVISNGEISWLTAYEHASQDDLSGLFNKQKLGDGNLINDAMQGVKGEFNFKIEEDDFKFLGISSQLINDEISISVDALRGAYLEGELIDSKNTYSTVWTATGFYEGGNLEDGKAMIRNYLFNQICEKPASRIPEFYYNTWGMQRNDKTKPLRGILTYKRIFEEIEYASELGVDIFVLDDGWENAQGEWFPNKERFTEGLAPIKKKLDEHGLKMGLWYSPMGIDSTTQSYKDHPNWVIKDSEGTPILAQWNHPAFDFVGGFFDVFVEECKRMIDQGCRFMKWDAINTFYSSLPNLQHGSDKYSEEELRERYEYLLPIYVVRAMEELTNYEPELIIEMDVTEARRVMVGLAPLSQGKMFWMNNGASWYNDYSAYRTQSMRTIANEFAGIIPLELFTYANYPHNLKGDMKYNINNSLLAGHGFWGNLELMTSSERKWIGSQVSQSKKVLPFLVDVNPSVIGAVGDSPEIYSIVNTDESAGQIVLFSEKPFEKEFTTRLESTKLLAVLNYAYSVEENQLNLSFKSKENTSSIAVFILPNGNAGVSIVASTSELITAKFQNGKLEYVADKPGEQTIYWDNKNGKPTVGKNEGIELKIEEKDGHLLLYVKVKEGGSRVVIEQE